MQWREETRHWRQTRLGCGHFDVISGDVAYSRGRFGDPKVPSVVEEEQYSFLARLRGYR
jgi:hypothetical protein